MLENIAQSFSVAINKLRFYDDEKSLKKALDQLKKSLLKSDVHYKVTKELIQDISRKASIGQIGKESFIRAVEDSLFDILDGSKNSGFVFSTTPPTVVLMTGLQGSGKTTTCAKLAHYLKLRKKKVLLVAADTQRLAAKEQLAALAQANELEFFTKEANALEISSAGVEHAKKLFFDVVIIDTAGRLAIDESLMQELSQIQKAVLPDEVFYVADSLTGQDAVKTAETFKQKANATAIILTKFDSNATGGVGIGIAKQTALPLRFVGVGEKVEDLEHFVPKRIVSRLLGRGDEEGLAERVSGVIDDKKAKVITKKIKKGSFNFNDFLEQMNAIKKMGSMKSLISMMPGLGAMGKELANVDLENSKDLEHIKAIIGSMTPKERENPDLLNPSRKRRLAIGSGLEESHINRVLKQFKHVSKMAKKLSSQKSMAGVNSMFAQKAPFR